jgi:hypothetical protein
MQTKLLALSDVPRLYEMNTVFSRLVSVLLALAGMSLFIMLIVGGYKLITSGTDPKAADAAKQTITNAIIGIVIVACAYTILSFLSSFTGVTSILNFNIYHKNP